MAQLGDFWRLLIKSSVIQNRDLSRIEARIVQLNTNCFGVWDGSTVTDTTKRAVLRKQYCENYTEFVIKVNSTSTIENYKQFALTRSNGGRVLGTIKATATTAELYAQKIQEHFEAYPYATVIVHRKGTLLKVRVYNNNSFRLNDEAVTVGIGLVSDKNTNAPSITASLVDTISYAARYSYEVAIENVEPGNIFVLNGTRYEAATGDDAATVKAALLSGQDRLIVLQSETVSASATKGIRYLLNTNTPSISLAYHSNSGGNDRYVVTIGESLSPGNTFQITASGEPTASYTVEDGDDAATVKAALVSGSGYYEVPTGTTPTWSVVAGVQAIENVNTPSIKLEDQQEIEATTKDKYRVIVGSSITKGNVFTLGDSVYTAISGDDADDVGIALGISGAVDYAEVPENSGLTVFAKPGNRYTSEDVADITIVSQPRVKKSGQLVLEADFSGLNSGLYSVQLFDTITEEAFSYSNVIQVATSVRNTAMVEVSDDLDAHGYQYYESGLSQRIRLPIFLRSPKQRSSENRSKRIEGGYNRTITAVEDVREMVTQAESPDFHKCLALWLKHSKVWIEDQSYFAEGEYSETILSERPALKQAVANLVLSQEHNNRNYYFTTSSKPLGYGDSFVRGFSHGLTIVAKNGNFVYVLKEGSNYVQSAEYEVTIYNDGDARKVTFAKEGYEESVVLIPAQSVARLRDLVRVESEETLEILCERTTAVSVTYSSETVESGATVTRYSDEKRVLNLASYSNDFGLDFST